MTTGQRIKKIREFRGLTQTAFGILLGYPEKSASVRIAQYEGSRMPKKDTLIEMSKILKCNYIALYTGEDLGPAEEMIQQLFWFDEYYGSSFHVYSLVPEENNKDFIIGGSYNPNNYNSLLSPVGISVRNITLNGFLAEWAIRKNELINKEISRNEYFEWKINWPNSCDDCGKHEPTYNWRHNHQKDTFDRGDNNQ